LRFPQGSGYKIRVREYPKLPPRLRWIFSSNPVFFVTFCTHERRKLLATDAMHVAFVAFASQADSRHHIAVGRYVIMPDHVHFFVRRPEDLELGRWIGMLKQTLRNRLRQQRHRRSGSAVFLIMFFATMKAMPKNGITSGRIPFA
jgi:REP element-mobilizing transposase RayT